MKTKVFSPEGTDLASRRTAAHLRTQVTTVLKSGEKVAFDLSNVVSISESYADELFGVLALEYGIKEFVASVTIRGASPVVLRRIAEAIKERLEHQKLQETLQTLVTAQHVQQSQSLGKA
ncbi:MAG: STAS-like domain-containing protein [Proteobacteria bacterium]|nr:STAS-like domain-containing protein [Pseudomonadota bacterium]